jgi:hypothetical protein
LPGGQFWNQINKVANAIKDIITAIGQADKSPNVLAQSVASIQAIA